MGLLPLCRHQAAVQVTLEEGGSPQAELVIKGLAPNGFLLAEDERGHPCELHPDGNRYACNMSEIFVVLCLRRSLLLY